MALLWFDGFESYNDSTDINAVQKLSASLLSAYGSISSSGRNGRCWQNSYNYYDLHFYRVRLITNPTTVIFGFAMYMTSTSDPEVSLTRPFCRIYDPAGTTNLKFCVNGSRDIEVYGPGDVLIGTSTGPPLEGLIWYYIEIKVTIDNAVGTVEIRIGETQVLSLINKDTQGGSDSEVGSVLIGYAISSTRIDDLYICDNSGSENNDFLGDVRVDVLRANAPGTYTDFTPSAGSNYENVDEAYGPDDDTTYNDGANVADKDSYALGDLPSPAGTTIFGVKSQITVRKTDAGSRRCKILTRAGTTDDLGSSLILSDTFITHYEIYENNPADSLDWEDADVNGMEVGVEITSVSSSSSLSSSSSSSSSSA